MEQGEKFTVNPAVLLGDLKGACAMFWAAACGRYPVPWRSVVWALVFLLYFIIPFDFVSEAVFLLLGFGDDLLLFVYILNKMRPDIEKYRRFAKGED
jgi:uncharacterized membrane protein YkvA (DUF1232 family)